MAGRRLSIGRIAAITAWTGAAVAWGTAVVSVAAANPDVQTEEEAPAPIVVPVTETVLAHVPDMPDSGLIVVRYTPVERPEPEVIIQRRVVTVASPSQAPTKTKSSGS
jgi:hypothetical protein